VCWISYLHCISGCSWWVSFVICLSCHVVCWISYLHCISGCSWWVSFVTCLKHEIQHTTWQDKHVTNDTHQEHLEIQCKYEIQHTTWQEKQITNDTHQEHPEIQCKYEIQLFILLCCVLDFILTLYLWVFLVSVVCYLFILSCCVTTLTKNTLRYSVSMKSNTQHDKKNK
jgi:hypothetical protein